MNIDLEKLKTRHCYFIVNKKGVYSWAYESKKPYFTFIKLKLGQHSDAPVGKFITNQVFDLKYIRISDRGVNLSRNNKRGYKHFSAELKMQLNRVIMEK